MITRRKFVAGSVAASAASLLGCGRQAGEERAQPVAAAKPASLTVSFIGGTVFVDEISTKGYMTALQLRGKGVTFERHRYDHMSFVAAPERLNPAKRLDAKDAATILRATGRTAPEVQTACLLGKSITISGVNAPPINRQRCAQLVDYGHISSDWTAKDWTPGEDKAVSSAFTIRHGELADGSAINTTGAGYKWYVKDKGKEKLVTDVTVLTLSASAITIAGINPSPIELKANESLWLAVFSGPLFRHAPHHKYKKLSHANLLTTIYNTPSTSVDDILPRRDTEVDGMEGSEIANPCDSDHLTIRVPPDSEYCPNSEGPKP